MISDLLVKYGLRLHPSAPDGACLFHSLALFYQGMTHDQLRAHLCHYILTHADRFRADIEAEYGCNVQTYCHHMQKPSTMGDGIMLQAFTLAFQINVYVFMQTGVTKIGDFEKNIAVILENQHYSSAIPL